MFSINLVLFSSSCEEEEGLYCSSTDLESGMGHLPFTQQLPSILTLCFLPSGRSIPDPVACTLSHSFGLFLYHGKHRGTVANITAPQ